MAFIFSEVYYPFLVIGLVIGLYIWRVLAVNTYNYLLEQRKYEYSHKVPMVGDDSNIEYIQYDQFDGPRKGFVFRYGSKGVGYYRDSPPPVPAVSVESLDREI
jgi:hypothetical protein